ncbi:putative Rossmann fold nucleotide-binding protein DprA/Smf involved in DNA uptake [Sphingomonas sp. BE123]|uniref:DNA-processing protein DprA n=1 Tax=Sphingomonas sp. BE123 TaxID=2817842 RepID=UPI0028568A6B|nr:DNA-processing protein DprA [Sphingomonas sp. BE123]MDR6852694.1 putative Rossmann fold nucleotide-binding protein DprA/Smf involved in DNA uptake [Sphingomonas sp. BE123]
MLEALTPDTQTTLLLVGRFSKSSEAKPLTTVEYNRLAKQLHELGLRPADIMHEVPKGLVADRARLTTLLSRGTSLALAVERWARLGIRVVGRGDTAYPKSLKKKLRGAAAPVLYIAGNSDLLDSEAVCVVGSRNVSPSGLEFAAELGKRCASEGLTVVSGDARGVDRAAMDGALEEGGSVTAVLVDALTKAVLAKRNRDPILAGKLVLISPYDPEANFTVAKAMDRNKYMYALASAAVVVDSDIKGGTWSGAIENEKHRWTPAFVRVAADAPAGNPRLADLGLRPIPQRWVGESSSLKEFLFAGEDAGSSQLDLLAKENPPSRAAVTDPAKSLYAFFLEGLTAWLTDGPQPDTAIADRFELERSQARLWLDRAHKAGILEKLQRPARYALRRDDPSSGLGKRSQFMSELPL